MLRCGRPHGGGEVRVNLCNCIVDIIILISDPTLPTRTVIQDVQFAALKEREYFLEILMIFSNFKPKTSPFFPFLLEKWSKIHKIGDFGCKNSSKFEKIKDQYLFLSAAN